jgi:hypothetical protein
MIEIMKGPAGTDMLDSIDFQKLLASLLGLI